MIRRRWDAYRERVRAELEPAFAGSQPVHVVAGSFAIGVFITALPTLGTGLLVMGALVYLSEWINKIALFASVVVLNPLAKSGVYVVSFSLGTRLLGPIPGVSASEVTLTAGPAVVRRLLLGNAILAVLFAAVAYAGAHYGVRTYRRSAFSVGDLLRPE